MITFRRILRLKNDERLSVILLAVMIVCIIRLCNKRDEQTANQYVLEDDKREYSQSCPLYPLTLQGTGKHLILECYPLLIRRPVYRKWADRYVARCELERCPATCEACEKG